MTPRHLGAPRGWGSLLGLVSWGHIPSTRSQPPLEVPLVAPGSCIHLQHTRPVSRVPRMAPPSLPLFLLRVLMPTWALLVRKSPESILVPRGWVRISAVPAPEGWGTGTRQAAGDRDRQHGQGEALLPATTPVTVSISSAETSPALTQLLRHAPCTQACSFLLLGKSNLASLGDPTGVWWRGRTTFQQLPASPF